MQRWGTPILPETAHGNNPGNSSTISIALDSGNPVTITGHPLSFSGRRPPFSGPQWLGIHLARSPGKAMLNKLFLATALALVVTVIAGESYRHGMRVGAQHNTAQSAPTRPRINPPAPRSTPRPARTSEISTLERLYLLQTVQDARRAREAAERAERLIRQELRAARMEQDRLLREQTRLVREQRQVLQQRTTLRAATTRSLYTPPPSRIRQPVSRAPLSRPRPVKRTTPTPVIVQHQIHRVVVGQLPVQVETVNRPSRLLPRLDIRESQERLNQLASQRLEKRQCVYAGRRFLNGQCVSW